MFRRRRSKNEKFISFKDLLPRILVKDPVTHDSWDKGRFTTYLICIKTEHPSFHLRLSAVRRRFSELRWLYTTLKANHPHIHFPKAPSKKVFAERFESDFIKSRMTEIQSFLNQLMVTDTVLSDAAFHLFVQTDLTPDEIEEHLNGTLSETIIKEAWDNAGHLHSSSYIVNRTTFPDEPQIIVMNEEDLQPAPQRSRSFCSSGSDPSFENSVPATNNAALSEPGSNHALTVSATIDELSVPTTSSALYIPENKAAISVHYDNDAISVPENNSAISVPENISVSEKNNDIYVPENKADNSVPEVSDVPFIITAPTTTNSELVDVTNQNQVISSNKYTVSNNVATPTHANQSEVSSIP